MLRKDDLSLGSTLPTQHSNHVPGEHLANDNPQKLAAAPRVPTVFADDLAPHDTFVLGTHTVTRDEIVDFARKWDPQGFHVDDATAEGGTFGEVIASGAHIFAVLQRLSVEAAYRHWAVVAGRAVRDLELPWGCCTDL